MNDTLAPSARPDAPRPTPWALIICAWAAFGLLITAQQHTMFTMSSRTSLPWGKSLLLQMPLAAAWAMATPGILFLGRRYPFERGKWPASVAVHTAASLLLVVLLDLGYAYHYGNVLRGLVPERTVLALTTQLFVGWGLFDGLFYWLIITVAAAALHQRRAREREVASLHLATQLAEADLHALKMQLHPHFLFNALHTIGSLVRTGERDDAVRVVAGLGDLLRGLLDGASSQEVPLRKELEFIGRYLEIEQIRFRDRLTVTMSVDSDALDAYVPHLILQPLVENAIRHGIGPHRAAGRLLVSARRVNNRLQLRVQDDGPGADDAARPGIGLSNTRARLGRLYGDDFELEVCNAPGGGLEARVEVPFCLARADGDEGP